MNQTHMQLFWLRKHEGKTLDEQNSGEKHAL